MVYDWEFFVVPVNNFFFVFPIRISILNPGLVAVLPTRLGQAVSSNLRRPFNRPGVGCELGLGQGTNLPKVN